MLLIAGLGNTGPRYANNRHNIGFMAADEIFRRHSFSNWSTKFKAEISDGKIGDQRVLLLKPQTMMNLSGEAVGQAMRFYKIELNDVIVIYDELDLAPGKARIKIGGGAGGHNGIRSIDAHCGKEYKRLRLGIGHPGHKDRVHNHVLGDFAKSDRSWLDPLLDAIGENADLLARGEDASFMNKLSLANGSAAQKPAKKQTKSNKSHIHQARQPKKTVPTSGPMADMLKKLFGGNSGS